MARSPFPTLLVLLVLVVSVAAATSNPLGALQVTLKGEVYYVSDVSTAQELQHQLEVESGWNRTEQGAVTYQGKVLNPEDRLIDAGIHSGDQVNIIPKQMADHWTMMGEMGNGLLSLREKLLQNGIQSVTPEQLEELQIMTHLYHDLTTKMPFLQEEMETFSQFLKNPEVADRATDPDRVESLRQIILNNPLLLSMVSTDSPSTKAALQDGDLWLEHVTASVDKWKTLTGYELWQRYWWRGAFLVSSRAENRAPCALHHC